MPPSTADHSRPHSGRLATRARSRLEEALNGPRRVGISWQSTGSFVRIVTNPRALAEPMRPAAAWSMVESWLDAPAAWVPTPSSGYREILGRLLVDLDLTPASCPTRCSPRCASSTA